MDTGTTGVEAAAALAAAAAAEAAAAAAATPPRNRTPIIVKVIIQFSVTLRVVSCVTCCKISARESSISYFVAMVLSSLGTNLPFFSLLLSSFSPFANLLSNLREPFNLGMHFFWTKKLNFGLFGQSSRLGVLLLT